ncbi:MAG: hypothetical protein M1609_14320 [Firmicutes bacterium]|nr:hypothetical protein [Bacillota bacterium]
MKKERRIRKFFVMGVALTLLVTLFVSSAVTAAPREVTKPEKKVIQVSNPEAYARQMGLKPPSPNAKLVGITLVIDGSISTDLSVVQAPNSVTKPAPSKSSVISPQALTGYYYLYNVRDTGNTCGLSKIGDSYYPGPCTATMTVSSDVSATWSANVGVSAEVVSAGVGFTVTNRYGVSDSYGVSVPSGQTYEIIAHPVYDNKSYDVMWHPYIGWESYAGSGNAAKPIGVCFVQYSV